MGELLNKILWAYNVTQKTSTNETPFLLTYRTEAIIPVEIRCLSHRVVYYTLEGN
jgi:hypothetical protein